ncbi:hypothetical protein [Aquimarina sp. MMG016]|uniref:hypothetical protein n=1 Tax=Aquimarina sp. MMG016 TaxID=2822690 RepID=UPI001B3A00A8|nr:hypothetical protein [Aquimarina sp. MMG016]MBQ4820276.1 hypothetical protein [Aquimarina sp. MMG016]
MKQQKNPFNFEETSSSSDYGKTYDFPSELQAAIGLISMNFQSLEDSITDTIIEKLNVDREIGEIITAELSFKNKVNLLASLLHKTKDKHHLDDDPDFDLNTYHKKIIGAFFKCEELRNQTLPLVSF